ncbi:MAG: uroporphyrinogen-III C-methyltransferase [Candidatus Limnocylindrales bacterium]
MSGIAYLVGAGPGSADLITVRGLRLLRGADAVVYDHLIDEGLLDEVPQGAEQIYVGKEAGAHTLPQETINALLVDRVRRGGCVVRLKGGDPYVFGRGGEEALALREAGLPFEVVPGVTSAVAVPGAAGIPVTHRGLAGGFAVFSARTRTGQIVDPSDIERYARVPTLVILMGHTAVGPIMRALIDAGRDPDESAAAISRGATCSQRVVTGTLATLPGRVLASDLPRPVTLVVGDVVAMHSQIS